MQEFECKSGSHILRVKRGKQLMLTYATADVL